MKIRILTFGIAQDITGAAQVELVVPETHSVADLRQALYKQYPALQRLSSLLIAVNAQYSADETLLQENDEVALIPPVSGG